ncbi:MAG: F0F1 ATP synthase subunit A [Chloroflexi bacterium]|nr:F0F1 ATP synthase subunit A [Chloroflexota bacterium]
MPSGAAAKRVMLLAGLVMVALLIAGFVVGAIGSQMFGTSRFLDQPAIHLPPQPIFPFSAVKESLGYSDYPSKDKAEAKPTADAEHPPASEASGHESGAEEEHHFTPLPVTQFAITNTLLSAWVASLVIILFFVLGARKKAMVPGRFQSVVESIFEGVLNFASSVLGPDMARKAFPVVATIFFFVLFNAWIALFLVPLYQAVGFGSGGLWDFKLEAHLIRPAGTDVNMPLALALVSFVFVEYWGLRVLGLGYFKKFFAFGNLLRGRPSGLIDVFVGILELISELVRIVSFTFRLFGNMTAGEILVVMITFLVPFVANIFVFGLELLVGLIQAVIFAGLTLVFLSLAVHHEEH